jgi:hypothetical protein
MTRGLALPILLAVVVVGAGVWWLFAHGPETGEGINENGGAQVVPRTEGGARYASAAYGFSFVVPAGYTAHALGADANGTASVIVQSDSSSGSGLQVSISPFDENLAALTAARIKADLPDVQIAYAKNVQVAPGVTGLKFASNNPAYDGASEELWFVYKGNLYQLATYQKSAALLDTIWGTWKWE